MKTPARNYIAGSLVAVAAISAAIYALPDPKPVVKEPPPLPAPRKFVRPEPKPPTVSLTPPVAIPEPAAPPEEPPIPVAPQGPLSPREQAIENMQVAATSYDPAQLSVIRPYLLDPDPKIRSAAVDAMVVLGDASAGPMLREAAKQVASPDEAKFMEKFADYVELPPVDINELAKELKLDPLE